MPELPEVETIVQELSKCEIIGVPISGVIVQWPKTIDALTSQQFRKQLLNQKIQRVERRGKFIVLTLDRETLLIHLRMTGKFFLKEREAAISPHERLRICFGETALIFEDQRKFGRWYLLKNPEEKLSLLGFEPLSSEFTKSALSALLARRSKAIKPFLLDQHQVAGLGNIYVDEALWEAGIHPLQPANSLTRKDVERLHRAIQLVLKKGISNCGTTLGNARANYYSVSGRRGRNQDQLNVFRQEGRACPRCKTKVVKIRVAQRGTHFCPKCQCAYLEG